MLHRFSGREGGAGGARGADRLASRGETPPAVAVAPLSETPTAALAPLSVTRSIEEGQGLGPWARAALSVLLRQSVQGEAPDGVWCFRLAEGVDAMVVVPLSVCSGVPLLWLMLPSPVVEAVTGLSGATVRCGFGALTDSPLAGAVPGRASVPPVVAVVWHQTMPAEGGEPSCRRGVDPALVASSVL